MKVIGILLLVVGGGAGFLALSEFGRYSDLENSGNPFSGSAANSGVYLAGIAATAVLAGIGFLLMPRNPGATPSATAPGENPYADMVWTAKSGWQPKPTGTVDGPGPASS